MKRAQNKTHKNKAFGVIMFHNNLKKIINR